MVCNKFEELWEVNSPIWVRPQDGTLAKGMFAPGFLQVVGHTPVEEILVQNQLITADTFSTSSIGQYIGNREYMMTILRCNLGNEKDGYSFDEAPNGFTVFKRKDYILKTYWIRDDVYRSNVHNVIEAFDNYDGNTRFLRSPVCACKENKLRFTQ